MMKAEQERLEAEAAAKAAAAAEAERQRAEAAAAAAAEAAADSEMVRSEGRLDHGTSPCACLRMPAVRKPCLALLGELVKLTAALLGPTIHAAS